VPSVSAHSLEEAIRVAEKLAGLKRAKDERSGDAP
jgi:hypothetical protein